MCIRDSAGIARRREELVAALGLQSEEQGVLAGTGTEDENAHAASLPSGRGRASGCSGVGRLGCRGRAVGASPRSVPFAGSIDESAGRTCGIPRVEARGRGSDPANGTRGAGEGGSPFGLRAGEGLSLIHISEPTRPY